MDYKNIKFGKYVTRRNYSNVDYNYNNLVGLLDIQIDKFKNLLDNKLNEIFKDIFNLNLYENRGKSLVANTQLLASIKYKGVVIGEPRRSISESILYNKNYEVPIYIKLEFADMKYGIQIPEKKVYLFDLPLMTDDGSFVINGSYKVIIPQIIRSNGIYFNKSINFENQKDTYSLTILPALGLWIIFDFIIKTKSKKNTTKSLFLRVDQNKKINFVYLLKSLGVTNDLLFDFFGDTDWLKKSISSNSSSLIFDGKYINFILNIIKKLDVEKTLSEEQFQKCEIISIVNNDLYFYVKPNTHFYNFVVKNLISIENELNNELDTFYTINIVTAKQMKIDDNLNVENFTSEKKSRSINVKQALLNIGDFPQNFVSALTKKGSKSLLQMDFTKCDNIEDLSLKLSKILSKMILSLRQKNNDISNFLLSFYNYSKDVGDYIKNEYIGNFITEDLFISKREKNNQSEFNKAIKLFYSVLKPGDPFPKTGSDKFIENLFFDLKKYNISNSGLLSLKNKLNIIHRISQKFLAKDIVDSKGKIVLPKDTFVTHDVLKKIVKFQEKDYLKKTATLLSGRKIFWDEISIYHDEVNSSIIKIIGVNQKINNLYLDLSYIISAINYLINLENRIGYIDDIDSLENRRVKTIDEIFADTISSTFPKIIKSIYDTYFREFKGNTIPKTDKLLSKMISSKNLSNAIREFVNISQLSQFLDQTNPLSNVSNKRRITALGPGGLNKERAGLEVRDVHTTHFGRICPIETPEGQNIGLISNIACFSKVNNSGFLLTPYYAVNNGIIDKSKIHYLSVFDERDYYIGEFIQNIDKNNKILDKQLFCRINGKPVITTNKDVDFVCVSGNQIISIATGLIPFLENDDSNRTLMGANMQRQALPLLTSESPYVGTGQEYLLATSSNLAKFSQVDGIVKEVNSSFIDIIDKKNKKVRHNLKYYEKTNQNTVWLQKPLVNVNDKVKANDLIADGSSMDKGELALGKNVLVAFTTFYGYNYEDAIIISERLVKDDVFTSVKIEEIQFEVLQTKLGPEEVTYDVPFVSTEAKQKLDANGIVNVGSIVEEGDILVGKVTPKSVIKAQPELELLNQIFGQKAKNIKNSSLVTPTGLKGVVINVEILDSKKSKEDLPDNTLKIIKIYIATKRKIQAGDKLAGRHGNKGVISIVLPESDMPFLKDGTPIDIVLNPLGVPSRMNIGQILELQLGYSMHLLKEKIVCPSFEGLSFDKISKISKEANTSEDGKYWLYDGYTGEPFNERISVGYMYMLKLNHMVEDKMHVRCTGNYSLITQQPLGGKSQKGGQRFGEMEVWALEGYGAAHLLQEILTIKSDDIFGRIKSYENIIRGKTVETPQAPASIKVLFNEMRAIGLRIDIMTLRDLEENELIKNQTKLDDKSKKGASHG